MEGRPTLFWYGLDGLRKGLLHPNGPITHLEELKERDELGFRCQERPEKYDRILWFDVPDGKWREHWIREVRTIEDGCFEVYAEGALFETRLDFFEALRLQETYYQDLLERLVVSTRFSVGEAKYGGIAEGFAWITRKSVLEGLRVLERIYNIEFYLDIIVDEDNQCVGERRLSFTNEIGEWRGLRLERGRNLHEGNLVVHKDEVVTALYGFGASFGAYDEDGVATGGYTRRLTFGDINNGKNYVEDQRAKETYGRIAADGKRMHNFGYVIFDQEEDEYELRARTRSELQNRKVPRVGYDVEGDIDVSEHHVELGDSVLIVDGESRVGMRVRRRERIMGETVAQRVRLCDIGKVHNSNFRGYENRANDVIGYEDALIKAGLKRPEEIPGYGDALEVSIELASAKRFDGTSIDLRWVYELRASDIYEFDVTVRNNLPQRIVDVNLAIPRAGIDAPWVHMDAHYETVYSIKLSPTAQDVLQQRMVVEATGTCPGGKIGYANAYEDCIAIARFELPLSKAVKPVNVIPNDLVGDGSFRNPYTIEDLNRCTCVSTVESALEDVWVSGFIVGWAEMNVAVGLNQDSLRLGAEDAVMSNIVLADFANATNASRMIPVNLSTATRRRLSVRYDLNLEDNPYMLGRRVWLLGDVLRYGRTTGMRRVDEYRWCDAGGRWHGYNTTYDGKLFEDLMEDDDA